jgi:inhibitor of growth protein 3
LLEEIQAKDRVVEDCRNFINSRDNSIQKFLKANGASQPNPKEEAYVKNIIASYEKAQNVQEEKIALAERSAHLVCFVLILNGVRRLRFLFRSLLLHQSLIVRFAASISRFAISRMKGPSPSTRSCHPSLKPLPSPLVPLLSQPIPLVHQRPCTRSPAMLGPRPR